VKQLQPSTEAILAMFAIDRSREGHVLAEYIARYPQAALNLVAYAHELDLQSSVSADAPLDAAMEDQISRLAGPGVEALDPFARLQPTDFQRLRQMLGVPMLVLSAFRDRMVAAGTVPLGFLDRLASALDLELGELVGFLAGPPRLTRAVQHKSDGIPAAASAKFDFAELLGEAGVEPQRVAELLAE
jgi:hypothetical protein